VSVDVLRAGPTSGTDSITRVSDTPPGVSDTTPHVTPAESTAANDASRAAPGTNPSAIDSLARASTIHETAFDVALAARDADGAVAAILELESAIVEWSRDTLQSDDVDRARAALRSMIVRLGAAATEGVRDVREVLGPVVEAALAARVVARSEKAFAVSDAIRDELAGAGIEVRDTPDGVEWLIAES
jgi:cysteinyl-tRNA synthetase